MFPEGLVSQSLGHCILLTSHHLNLAKSNQMSFPPKLCKLHLFSVIDNTVILPQNSSLGHVVSSFALQIHHLVGSADQSPALYIISAKPSVLWKRRCGWRENGATTGKQEYDNQGAFSSTKSVNPRSPRPVAVAPCSPWKSRHLDSSRSHFLYSLCHHRTHVPKEGIRWNCRDCHIFYTVPTKMRKKPRSGSQVTAALLLPSYL